MRKQSTFAMLVAAALACAALPSRAWAQAEYNPPEITAELRKLPNIVLITGDHLRWDHIAANGNPAIITPNIDRLAREGSSFLKCFTVGIACSPNRASLMTGRYPHSHGIMSNGIKMPRDEVTLTHVLRDKGYYTGQMGKLHFMPHKDRNHREPYPPYGFHQMRLSDEPGCYDDDFGRWLWAQGKDVREKARVTMPGDRARLEYYVFEGTDDTTHASWAATETATFIEDATSTYPGRPFFVHTGFYAPHPPLNPPASSLAKYDGRVIPDRLWRPDETDYLPPSIARAIESLRKTPEDTWREYKRFFYAMVTHLDENVGRIMEAVEKSGEWDRTIFVITSDHGDYLGDNGLVSKSDRPYDGAMRIPLIFSGPGVPKGEQPEELVEIIDVMPTLLGMIGETPPLGNQGIPLSAVMAGGKGRNLIFMEGSNARIIRTQKTKYAIYGNGEEALFDLGKDPNEFRNIAGDASAKPLLDEMRKSLLLKTIESVDPLPERIRPY